MRYLLTLLCASACFSEGPSSTSDCPTGTPGCDCGAGDACDEGLECVLSIDKCVPTNCTPGTNTCTCDMNTCNSALVCEGGVCLDPTPDTTGGSVTNASTTPATDPSTSTTDPATVTSTSPTGETSTTSPDTSITVADTGDTSTSASASTNASSSSDTAPIPCPQCLEDAAFGTCADEYGSCLAQSIDFGCNPLQECVITNNKSPDSCCFDNNAEGAHAIWETFVMCAMANECGDSCAPLCLF